MAEVEISHAKENLRSNNLRKPSSPSECHAMWNEIKIFLEGGIDRMGQQSVPSRPEHL